MKLILEPTYYSINLDLVRRTIVLNDTMFFYFTSKDIVNFKFDSNNAAETTFVKIASLNQNENQSTYHLFSNDKIL